MNIAAIAQRAGDVREKYGFDQLVAVCCNQETPQGKLDEE